MGSKYEMFLALGVLIPLASFFILALWGTKFGKPGAAWVSVLAIGVSCLLGTMTLFGWLGSSPAERAELTATAAASQFHWADLGSIPIAVGVKLDSLTVIMYFMVTFIATWIHVFSVGYMAGHSDEVAGESKYHRFFAYLSLFCFSMLGLVISSSLLFMFIFWELVGLCSYLLIGFYFERKYASNAAMKAFITNRVGDLGFLVGMMIVVTFLGTLDLDQAAATLRSQYAAGNGIFATGTGAGINLFGWQLSGMALATLMGIGLFCGAMGKSAQFPLHAWLPDAMAGPTPVSALIHAATMVAAGVYLVARVFRLLTPDAQFFIAIIGCITLTITALIAIVQTDIKKILAYSTLSQLGYMIFGMGVGAWVAALFHLMTHAFFKAMLFLGSGQVIEGCHHEQDIRKMGGLWQKMPMTCVTFFIGVLAIAGFGLPGIHIGDFKFGLGGFFSKDEILAVAYERWNNWADVANEPGHDNDHAAATKTQGMHSLGFFGDGDATASVRLVSDTESDPHTAASGGHAEDVAHGEASAHGDEHAAGTGTPDKLAIASGMRTLPNWMFYLPIIIAYITPFYMMRCWWLTFCGKPRDHHVYDHAHESKLMWVPLVVLAIGTVFCSYRTFRPLIAHAAPTATDAALIVAIDGEAHHVEAGSNMLTLTHEAGKNPHTALITWVGFAWIVGMGFAWVIYRNGLGLAEKLRRNAVLAPIHSALQQKLYFDHVYDNVLVGGTVVVAFVSRAFDTVIVDGLVNLSAMGTRVLAFFTGRHLDMTVERGDFGLVDRIVNALASITKNFGDAARKPQTGRIRTYITLTAGAAAIALLVVLFYDQVSAVGEQLRSIGLKAYAKMADAS